MKRVALISLVTIFTAWAQASVVNFSGTPQAVTASGLTVNVYPIAQVQTVQEGVLPLKLSGFGIRQKAFGPFKINIYVAASYVEDPSKFTAQNPMDEIRSSRARVMQLTMLRGLSGSEIRNSFQEALQANNIDSSKDGLDAVLSQLGDVKAGDVITITGYAKDANDEEVVVNLPGQELKAQGPSASVDLSAVWFGSPVDSTMATLQGQLTGKGAE